MKYCYIFILTFLISCKSSSQSTYNVTANDRFFLQNFLKTRGISFGTFLNSPDILLAPPRPKNYLDEISNYFNIYTMNVSMNVVQRTQGVFDFTVPDKVVEFARAHNAKVRGHALVFAAVFPPWLQNAHYTPDQLEAILKTHVQTVVRHFATKYPGTVVIWHVVNEATCNGGNISALFNRGSCPEGIKKNIWTDIHKPGSSSARDYIELAFKWAHEADPSAKLFLNENNIEMDGQDPKIDRVYDLVKDLKSRGVQLDGIGIQCHARLYQYDKYSVQKLSETMNMFADLGLETQITEADVLMASGVQPNTSPTVPIPIINPTPQDYIKQANMYQVFLKACLVSKKCTGFVVGAPYDSGTWTTNYWKQPFHAHFLDDSLRPKAAYRIMLDEVKKDAKTGSIY